MNFKAILVLPRHIKVKFHFNCLEHSICISLHNRKNSLWLRSLVLKCPATLLRLEMPTGKKKPKKSVTYKGDCSFYYHIKPAITNQKTRKLFKEVPYVIQVTLIFILDQLYPQSRKRFKKVWKFGWFLINSLIRCCCHIQ